MKYYGIQNEVKAYINRLQDENGIFVSTATVKTINDRVESLKRSGVWSRFSLGFNDADGDAYLARAGVTNPLGRCEVLWFTRGIKSLDLWNGLLCWPLRNYQNAGTGSTIFGLGGQGAFNATIFNTAEWNVDGLRMVDTTSNGFARATFKVVTQDNFPLTMYVVNRKNGFGISNFRTLGQIGNGVDLINILRAGSTLGDGYRFSVTGMTDIVGSTLPLGIFYPMHGIVDRGRVSFNVNLGSTTTNTPALSTFSTTNTVSFATASPTGTGDSIQSVLIIILNREANLQLINTLYKSTLGNGLGLP